MDKLHDCSHDTKSSGWGGAIGTCYEKKDGTLWVDNGEYGSQVNFCPYCGYKARVLAINIKKYEGLINILKNLPTVEDAVFKENYRAIENVLGYINRKEVEKLFNIDLTDYTDIMFRTALNRAIPVKWKHCLVAYAIEKIKEKMNQLKGV